jgi:hypothetical protein
MGGIDSLASAIQPVRPQSDHRPIFQTCAKAFLLLFAFVQ